MSDNNFSKFVPGFDFLQSIAKGAASGIPQMPNPANWIAPTLSVEDLDKRITELKAVHFWLDQNAKALAATVTALEVQKMTLATLKGMNFNMGDVANAFKLKATETVANTVMGVKDTVTAAATGKKAVRKIATKKAAPTTGAGMIDPMQLWSSLTQQFGQIASSAMKDAAKQTALDTTKNMAKAMTKTAVNTAMNTANQTMQRVAAVGKAVAPKKEAARAVPKSANGKSKSKSKAK